MINFLLRPCVSLYEILILFLAVVFWQAELGWFAIIALAVVSYGLGVWMEKHYDAEDDE